MTGIVHCQICCTCRNLSERRCKWRRALSDVINFTTSYRMQSSLVSLRLTVCRASTSCCCCRCCCWVHLSRARYACWGSNSVPTPLGPSTGNFFLVRLLAPLRFLAALRCQQLCTLHLCGLLLHHPRAPCEECLPHSPGRPHATSFFLGAFSSFAPVNNFAPCICAPFLSMHFPCVNTIPDNALFLTMHLCVQQPFFVYT